MKIAECSGRKTGLFFGSFNPVHIGHMVLANYFLEFTPIDELQFVLSPQNPLKSLSDLASENDRLKMLEIALAAHADLPLSVNTIEFDLPKPSFTVNTLRELQKQNPGIAYVILMGADSLASIESWKDYETLLSAYEIWAYPRLGYDLQKLCKRYGVTPVEAAPVIEISATFLRAAVRNGYKLSTYFPMGVLDYIEENKLYL